MSEPLPINPESTNPELQVCIVESCGHARFKHRKHSDGALWCISCNRPSPNQKHFDDFGPCSWRFHAVGCECRWHGGKE